MVTVTASRVMDFGEEPGWDVSGVSVGPAVDPLVLLWRNRRTCRPTHARPNPRGSPSAGGGWPDPTASGSSTGAPAPWPSSTCPRPPRTTISRNRYPGTSTSWWAPGARTGAPTPTYTLPTAACAAPSRSAAASCTSRRPPAGIWAGYDDVATQGHAPGGLGAACFDATGRLLLGYNDLADARGIERIFDCYAMNAVSDAEVWLFYYVGFPLVRLVDGRIAGHWPALGQAAPIAGSDAFAVAGDRLLFRGGYHDRDRLYLVPLDGRPAQEVVPVDEGGASIATVWAFGRGSRLYLWTGRTLFGLDAASLAGP